MKTGPRQYTMMAPGSLLAGLVPGENGWQTIPTALITGGGAMHYYQNKLDLRGLDDLGLQPMSVTLQEGGPVILHATETSAFIIDVLTTVRPTEANMATWWLNINSQGNPPGFMAGEPGVGPDPDQQTLNPSQVTWGLWRLFGVNGSFRLASTDFPTQTIASGYFGQGEVQVPPSAWWTRLVTLDKDADPPTSLGIASSNLVVYAGAHTMTEPEEMTAMMRAVQR